jgi:hypothetical protein
MLAELILYSEDNGCSCRGDPLLLNLLEILIKK